MHGGQEEHKSCGIETICPDQSKILLAYTWSSLRSSNPLPSRKYRLQISITRMFVARVENLRTWELDVSQDVLITELEQRIDRADNHARDRNTVTASSSPPTKFDHLDAIIVKTIIVLQSSDTERTCTVILANEAQSASVGTKTRHWGNYKGLPVFGCSRKWELK